MPEGGIAQPSDMAARLSALQEFDRTFLVEAGAGCGKTSVMAGRVALTVAAGEDPDAIVAITFTEAAAAELRHRIEIFLRDLAKGVVPRDLAAALPDGVPPSLIEGAQAGLARFDCLTATTIHGFAQKILRPYPLEAGVDPGAAIADPDVVDLAFDEAVTGWMSDILNGDAPSFTGTLFDEVPARKAAELVREVAKAMRRTHGLMAPPAAWNPEPLLRVRRAIDAWLALYPEGARVPEEVALRSEGFRAIRDALNAAPRDPVARLLAIGLPAGSIATQKGDFFAKAANKKSWAELGLGKVEVERACAEMGAAWDEAREAWGGLKAHAAAVAARRLTEEVDAALRRYAAWKRAAALLDFDDLLAKARDLLARHDQIRRKLGRRYRRLLVDEFQDTDPVQLEIIWRISGDPEEAGGTDWRRFRIRPGALFLVGDPKQAIYRFRGADVRAYLEAKELLAASGDGEVLTISVNFRSTAAIIGRVNRVFEAELAAPGQPGFTALEAFRQDEGREVQALEVVVGQEALDDKGNPTVDGLRLMEARAVADFLQRIIGSLEVPDKEGRRRPCMPGDVALLAPAGTAFWIYEAELERAGIPIAPQAGKGFLRRQEVLDLIALARAVSDPRDSLALGAFLRGPVAGFTDEAILDAVAALPAPEFGRRKLSIAMDTTVLPDGRFREVMETLQAVRRIAGRTTPYQALAAAVEAFAVRAVLAIRHPRSVERSYANLDAFLALSRAWDTRGLKAFADEMRRRSEDGTRTAEGRPDSGADAVSIVTMHSAKGLEWSVVVPINMATLIKGSTEPLATPEGLVFKILGVAVPGYEAAASEETRECERQRQRLLYVADTRARDLLVLPRYAIDHKKPSWSKLCKARLDELPSFDPSGFEARLPETQEPAPCRQTAAEFQADADRIANAHRRLVRRTPSRHEAGYEPAIVLEVATHGEEFVEAPVLDVRGGPVRGRLLHKLMEEVLTGETTEARLAARAHELVGEIAAGEDVDPEEAAGTVRRTLALPEMAGLRERLVAEVDVASHVGGPEGEVLTIGVADALGLAADGGIDVVVDWKSDVAATPATLRSYCDQMSDYLAAVGARRGLIVLMTEGRVVEVARA